MAKINISEAARMYGISRRTLQRHIQKGRISADIGHNNQRFIDVSELIRVYGEAPNPPNTDTSVTHDISTPVSHDDHRQTMTTKDVTTPAHPKISENELQLIQELKSAQERERIALTSALEAERHASKLKDELLEEQRKRLELQERLLPSPERAKSKHWWQFWK